MFTAITTEALNFRKQHWEQSVRKRSQCRYILNTWTLPKASKEKEEE